MNPSLRATLHNLVRALTQILRGELHLAQTEAKATLKQAAVPLLVLGGAVFFAVLTLACALVFLVAGFGRLLNGQYWLSALILAGIFALVSAMHAVVAIARLRRIRPDLPETRRSLREERRVVVNLFEEAAARFPERGSHPDANIGPRRERDKAE